MTSRWSDWPAEVLGELRRGVAIPAHPLALDAQRRLDARRQRALTRYYLDSGAGGLAIGVHTTQFAIRDAGLYRPVLQLAMQAASEWARKTPVMIAGLAGRTAQAVGEAQVARSLGYHAGLLSLSAMQGASEDDLIAHAQAVAREIALVGFYLQPAVGGILLPASFWRRFAAIENVIAIKIAPFNRYRTLDVVRGVIEAGAADRVTLYTGNDDHIVLSHRSRSWSTASRRRCASRAACSAIGVYGSSGRSSSSTASTRRSPPDMCRPIFSPSTRR
jgi:dihydrodipicolinate synthase/N-acetylneuraminate lyase